MTSDDNLNPLDRNAMLSALFDSSPQATVVAAPDRRMQLVNPAFTEIFGYQEHEVIGRQTLMLYASEAEFSRQGKRRFHTGGGRYPDPYVVDYRRKDGSTFSGETIGTPIHDDHGEVTGFLGIITDVSDQLAADNEREKLLDQILQTQKIDSLGVLAGGIAHDFNNLLVGVLANATLVRDMLPPCSELQGFLTDIETAARRAADLSRDMLTFAGRSEVALKPLDLNELVEEIASLSRASVSKKAVLKFDLSDDFPVVEGDASQLRQIVMNLVVNAAESLGGEAGDVTISTGIVDANTRYARSSVTPAANTVGSYAWVEVADQGCGIEANILPSVFDPFFSTKFAGRGLGLATVLGITRAHDGLVHVTSEPGHGTTIRVSLPLSTKPAESQDCRTPHVTSTRPHSGTVLVIDDERVIHRATSRVLTPHGYSVLTAADGSDGIKVFEDNAEDVQAVVLDLNMPGMGGEETLTALRRRRSDVPIVLMSGDELRHYPGLMATTTACSRTTFLRKPFEVDALVASVQQVVSA